MKYSVCSYWLINQLIINRLINRYEVFCMFTGFKWLPPSQLHACTNCETTCKMDAIESRSYLQPVVSLLCGNTSVSKWTTALKGSRTICTLCKQKVAHGGGTTNLKNHLRTKHCSTYVRLSVVKAWVSLTAAKIVRAVCVCTRHQMLCNCGLLNTATLMFTFA